MPPGRAPTAPAPTPAAPSDDYYTAPAPPADRDEPDATPPPPPPPPLSPVSQGPDGSSGNDADLPPPPPPLPPDSDLDMYGDAPPPRVPPPVAAAPPTFLQSKAADAHHAPAPPFLGARYRVPPGPAPPAPGSEDETPAQSPRGAAAAPTPITPAATGAPVPGAILGVSRLTASAGTAAAAMAASGGAAPAPVARAPSPSGTVVRPGAGLMSHSRSSTGIAALDGSSGSGVHTPTPPCESAASPTWQRGHSGNSGINSSSGVSSSARRTAGETGAVRAPEVPVVAPLPALGDVERTFPDVVGTTVLRTAYHMHETLRYVLESINSDFRLALLGAFGQECEGELNTIFGEVGPFAEAVRQMAETLRAKLQENSAVQLAAVVAVEGSNYLVTMGRFVTALNDGFFRLDTLRANMPGFADALAACRARANPDLALEDLFLFAASFPQQLLQLCKTQIAYRAAFERAHAAVHGAALFCQPLFPAVPVAPPFAACELPTNSSLKGLGAVALSAAELAAWIGGTTAVRQIRMPPGTPLPDALAGAQHRKLVDIVPGVLSIRPSYGLGYEVPASLLFFSDCLVLCRNAPSTATSASTGGSNSGNGNGGNSGNNTYQKYLFVHMYTPDTLWYHVDSNQKAFTLASHVPCTDTALPPGWEDASNSRKKERCYVYKTGGLKQETHPTAHGRLVDRFAFAVHTAESLVQTSQKLQELTNDAEMPECAVPAHTMIGVDVDTLVAFDRQWAPELQVPELCAVLMPYLVVHGVGEKGIFRVAAEKRVLDELCELVQTQELARIDLDSYNINVVSGLMKMFLRDTPTPLLTTQMYNDFLEVANMTPEDQTLRLTDLVGLLPPNNRALLRALMNMLYQMNCNQHVNAMNDKNLGIVTAPNILRNTRAEMVEMNHANLVVAAMIEHYEDIFVHSPNRVAPAPPAPSLPAAWAHFKRKLLGNEGSVRALAHDPDGRTVLAVDGHGYCVLFDARRGTFLRCESVAASLGRRLSPAAALCAHGRYWIAFLSCLLVVDARTLEVVHTRAPLAALSLAAPTPDEVWVGGDGAITDLAAADGATLATIDTGALSVFSLVAVGGQVWGACKGPQKSAFVQLHHWDVATRAHVAATTTDLRDVFALAAHAPTGTVWAASENPCVCVWDAATRACRARITAHPTAFCVCALDDQVWFGAGNNIVVVDPASCRCVGELRGYHTNSVSTLVLSRNDDATEVWSGSFDKSVCVWTAEPLPSL